MALNGSRKDAITHRRENVARLRLRGLSIREIIDALARMSPPMLGKDGKPWNVGTIHTDLKALNVDWQARAAEAIDARKARQLAEIDEAKRKAWADGDVGNLLRALKLESDIFGTMAPTTVKVKTWQDDVVELLRTRKVAPAEVVSEYGASLAAELFAQAGVDANDAA